MKMPWMPFWKLCRLSVIRPLTVHCQMLWRFFLTRGSKKSGLSEEEKKELVLTVLEKALSETQKARAKEGEALQASLLSQVKILFDLLEDTKAKLTVVLPDYKAKLTQKIKELAEHIDEARLAQEMAIYLQKIDIDEELVRLQIHLKEIEQLLQNGGVVGKKSILLFRN